MHFQRRQAEREYLLFIYYYIIIYLFSISMLEHKWYTYQWQVVSLSLTIYRSVFISLVAS